MLQVLFTIPGVELFGRKWGPFAIRSYGVLLVIGVFLALWWARNRAEKHGIKPSQVVDAVFWGVIPGILGARIGFIVQEWDYYSKNLDEVWSWQFAGLTSFGGVVFALLGLLFYAKRAKLNTWAFFDVVGIPLLVAHAVGRVGCLLNGCCYGHPTDAWYGVRISDTISRLYEPAQLLDASLVMFGVGFLLLYERKPRVPGTSFALVIVVWGLARFIYEFFRAGTESEVARGLASSTYWGDLPITQAHAAALVTALVGCVVYWFALRQKGQVAECA
jgi:phosphatidylglycerol:prolipoprotein diacylglycerol transferase